MLTCGKFSSSVDEYVKTIKLHSPASIDTFLHSESEFRFDILIGLCGSFRKYTVVVSKLHSFSFNFRIFTYEIPGK